MTAPLFQAPSSDDADELGDPVYLLSAPFALDSLRSSGFDLTAAVGEAIDNSIEAGATLIRVEVLKAEDRKTLETVAIADNGHGIKPGILAKVLQVGYSSRYGSRQGLGRFGMGLKLAGLSLGQRIDVFTRPLGAGRIYSTYLSLEHVRAGKQSRLQAAYADGWPRGFERLMAHGDRQFESGTLVLWREIDQIRSGGTYGTGLDEQQSGLRKFIARAYRKFLDGGKVVIELNGRAITLHDPLFLLENPRVAGRYPKARAEVIDQDVLKVAGHDVKVMVTLCPREFRPFSGAGGAVAADERDIRDLHIADNEGRLSIMRNGREIYYEIVPRLLPNGVNKLDRYIGIEVSFPAELDEFFQVRNVKRGAEPVNKLREELKRWLDKPIRNARRKIRGHWRDRENLNRVDDMGAAITRTIAELSDRELPRGRAGIELDEEETTRRIEEVVESVLNDEIGQQPDRADRLRASLRDGKMDFDFAGWPGTELMDITHVNGGATVLLNTRHPFMRDIVLRLKQVADNKIQLENDDMADLARRVEVALNLLFVAFAKAENMHSDYDKFSSLRTHWGTFMSEYVKQYMAKTSE